MQAPLSIEVVTTEGAALAQVRALFKAYLLELNADLCFQQFDTELENPLKKYAPPTGALLLARWNNEPVGCIAFQPLPEAGLYTCEMKRLFVLPTHRKLGIGEALVAQLLTMAKTAHYHTMVLDTLERLQPAIQLYQQFGFTVTTPYYHNPLQEVVYMQKVL
ncbi:MAG TPA: GNAT family N-acetyltransferase [Chitinophagaceae bacterium]|nr:GNAT family N-acetyltransferase [Chitinophagaceae bacterium]HAN39797.1 GNAT family N-acetyltransferase [Chitinophagaceae bacterium]